MGNYYKIGKGDGLEVVQETEDATEFDIMENKPYLLVNNMEKEDMGEAV